RPGVDVISRALPPPRAAPTDTGVAFLVGSTPAGHTPIPGNVTLVRSMTEFESTFGPRGTLAGDQASYDAADVFFREAGTRFSSPGTTGGRAAAGAEGEPPPKRNRAGAEPLVVDPGIQTALGNLTKDLGPGQVFIADPTLATVIENQSAVLAHCAAVKHR